MTKRKSNNNDHDSVFMNSERPYDAWQNEWSKHFTWWKRTLRKTRLTVLRMFL